MSLLMVEAIPLLILRQHMRILMQIHGVELVKQSILEVGQVVAAIRGHQLQRFIQDVSPPSQFLSDEDQAA
uniref:Uncharacterized protein n=1 Tax=Cannabis sativa TaxID=3483 RepID=A0A803QCQ6_CANSA